MDILYFVCSGPGYEFATRSIHPFTALMLINGQTSSTLESYIITVCFA